MPPSARTTARAQMARGKDSKAAAAAAARRFAQRFAVVLPRFVAVAAAARCAEDIYMATIYRIGSDRAV